MSDYWYDSGKSPAPVPGTMLVCDLMKRNYDTPRTKWQEIPASFWPMKPMRMNPIPTPEWGICRLCGNGGKIVVPLGYGVCIGCNHEHIEELFSDGRFVWHRAKKICWMATPATN